MTTAFLVCETVVALPQLELTPPSVRVSNSAEFYLGYLIESDDNGASVISGCRVAFETSVDAWVRKTLDPGTWNSRDNGAVATCNQPLLTAALRRWEQEMGSPITEWVSRPYPEQIRRYGFTSDNH
jgi:hypothetical protein